MNPMFRVELARHGPGVPRRRYSLPAARAWCRRLATRHYENFLVGSLLLPRRLLPHFHTIYAWCRWADDLADETTGSEEALRLLAEWREATVALWFPPPLRGRVREGGTQRPEQYPFSHTPTAVLESAARPSPPPQPSPSGGEGAEGHPILIALADTIRRFHLPPEPFLDLISAFEQDQTKHNYASYAELLDYCRRSANPVGRLLLHLFECVNDETVRRADSICTGLQLANFWQDVARDATMGRCYLPEEDMHRFGYRSDDWQARRTTPPFINLMRFQVERTHALFNEGELLVTLLPREFQPDVRLFLAGGRAVLAAIEQQGYDTWAQRPVVSKAMQIQLVVGSIADCGLRIADSTHCGLRIADCGFTDQLESGSIFQSAIRNPKSEISSYRFCSSLARRQAKNFYYTFLLLPGDQRRAMTALYAFMRITDDLADEPGPNRAARLARWRWQLDEALAGRPSHRSHPALLDTLHRFPIDPAWLHEAISGVASDLEPGRRFQTLAELEHYSYQVAGTVGLCCLRIWGCTAEAATPLAHAAGQAFQFTNILRDLKEDLAADRLYLPLDWLKAAGIDESALRRNPNRAEAKAVYRRLADAAALNYETAAGLLALLPPPGRAIWQAMSGAYRALLDLLRQRDFDPTLPRARLSRLKKAKLFLGALPTRFQSGGRKPPE